MYQQNDLYTPLIYSVCNVCLYIFLACLYESTGRAIAVTSASALAFVLLKCFGFKFFKSISRELVYGSS